MAYSDIDSGKVLNKEGLLELCGQIKTEIANSASSGGATYTAGDGINIDDNGVISAINSPLIFSMLQMSAESSTSFYVKLSSSSTWDEFVENIKANKIVYIAGSTSYTFNASYKLTPALLGVSTLYAMNVDSMSVPMMGASPSTYSSNGTQVYYSTYYYFDGAFLWSWKDPENLGNFIKVRYKTYKNYALGRALADINTDISAKFTAPSVPATDGSYKLNCAVSSGSPVYSWETDSGSSGNSFSGSYNDLTDKPTLFSGSYNDLTDKPTIPSAYTLPTASTSTLGGVKVDGSTITISNDIISANIPTYTAGSNISITNGVISATDTNTTYSAGTGISISGTTISVDRMLPPTVPTTDGYYVLKKATSGVNSASVWTWESISVGGSY